MRLERYDKGPRVSRKNFQLGRVCFYILFSTDAEFSSSCSPIFFPALFLIFTVPFHNLFWPRTCLIKKLCFLLLEKFGVIPLLSEVNFRILLELGLFSVQFFLRLFLLPTFCHQLLKYSNSFRYFKLYSFYQNNSQKIAGYHIVKRNLVLKLLNTSSGDVSQVDAFDSK